MTLHRERTDLREVLKEAAETGFSLVDAGRHALAHADRVRLVQIFSNFLSYAAKYGEPGGAIDVVAGAEGAEAVVCVRDTGVGIPAAMLPRVFDLFAQVRDSLDQAQGGLVIGLTSVQRLVELHGGRVEAATKGPGKGSEFVVRLPAAAQ